MMVCAIVRFDLAKTTAFCEGECRAWPTAYSVLPKSRESTDRLDRASKIFQSRLNKLNPNSETNNDIQLFLVSFRN